MTTYLVIVKIFLLGFVLYESYLYCIFKYKSRYVSATIKAIDNYEVFQRPSTKALTNEKRAVKITLHYEIDGEQYTKNEKITESLLNQDIGGGNIQLLVANNQPHLCSLKPHSTRFKGMITATILFIFWSILSILVFTL